MKGKLLIASVITVFALLIYGILCHNSFALSLHSVGLYVDEVVVIERGEAISGEYCVVAGCDWDNGYSLWYLHKNVLGWWISDGPPSVFENNTTPLTQYDWAIPAGSQNYTMTDTEFNWELHTVYCGSDARGQIPYPLEQLPNGVALNIVQTGEHYMMHFISYIDNIPNIEEAYAMITEFCDP